MNKNITKNKKTRGFGAAPLLCALALSLSLILCGCNDIFAPGYGPSIGGGGNESRSGSGDISDPGQGYFVGTETAPDAISGTLETVPDPSAGSEATVSDFVIETTDGSYTREGGTFILNATGTYTVSGRLEEGQIRVAAPESAEVKLVLGGVYVSNSSDSPIYAKTADKLKISVEENSYNEIDDKRPLKTSDSDEEGSAAIFAECDMSISGTGTLVVTSGYNNGIGTKDDLKLKELTLKVTCPDNCLKGSDSLTVESGKYLLISTSGDGLKTSNSDVSSKGNQRGTVTISGGVFEIYAGCDGIDAAYDLVVTGTPSITINTNSYSEYTDESLLTTSSQQGGGQQTPGWFFPSPGGGGRPGMAGGGAGGTNMSNRASESAKGLKADNEIKISGGVILANCRDDGIHANSDVQLENGKNGLGNVSVTGGNITLNVTDDGIHADGTLLISDGSVTVTNSYEGLEGHLINIEGGVVSVFATDDGINAQSSGSRISDGLITVSGGRVFVEVNGNDVDGIDSNGSYKQTGGIVITSDPRANSSGSAASVDTDAGMTVTGGILVALGTVPTQGGFGGRPGMGGAFNSALPSGYVTFTGTLNAGEHTFTFGDITVTFTLKNKVSSGWLWAEGISSGNYTLK